MQTPRWMTEMFDALDDGNIDQFCSHLSDDCSFIFANMPAVESREAIWQFCNGFLESIHKCDHTVDEVYSSPNRTIARGEVTYTRLDGSTLAAPFVNVFELSDEGIETYQVYVDNSAL